MAHDLDPARIADIDVDARIVDLASVTALSPDLTADYLEHYSVLPVRVESGVMLVATARAEPDPQALDDLRMLFDTELSLVLVDDDELRGTIRRVYGEETTAQGVLAGLGRTVSAAAGEIPLDDLVHLANEAPVVKLVNLLVLEALEGRASDVHLEAYAERMTVRYRIDGVLQDAASPPAHLAAAIISRLKIMAELDIAERRLPQDGRIRLRLQDRQVDVRMSTLPTLHGESVVLRLLDKEGGRIGLEGLGMAPDTLAGFGEVIGRPHGIVLATGPTGSGKTTSLYAAVDRIKTGREKILTVEDPVEYQLQGIPQVPVNEKVGVTFATALRALLRQDPDVMLIGEIRDAETAEMAVQAALTGHLVLSTLHTSDAAGAITRLLDLGVPPYLVAATLEAVLAQRLVRTICSACREEVCVADARFAPAAAALLEPGTVARGRGCPQCRGTGFRGRVGIYELLLVDDETRRAIADAAPADALRRRAAEQGMRTLRDDGLRLVREGITTLDEVLRVTRA